jgi:hypothetical protein
MRVGLDVIRAGLGHLLQTCGGLYVLEALRAAAASRASKASKASKSTQALYGR